jgi:hypothetical protein
MEHYLMSEVSGHLKIVRIFDLAVHWSRYCVKALLANSDASHPIKKPSYFASSETTLHQIPLSGFSL